MVQTMNQEGSGGGALDKIPDLRSSLKNGDKEQTGSNTESSKKFDARKARFALLAAAGYLMPESRIPRCFKQIIPGCSHVDVVYNTASGQGRVTNLIRCGLASCPVCGPWDRLQKGLLWAAMLERSSYKLAMCTMTLQHDRTESFAVVYDRLKIASKYVWSGRWYQLFKEQFSIAGRLTSLEVTHGQKTGFHPHYHMILVSSKPWVPQWETEASLMLFKRWQNGVVRAGGWAEQAAFDFTPGNAEAAQYLTKIDGGDKLESTWGIPQEAMLVDFKKGRGGNRSELQLLADYALQGDELAGSLWAEIQRGLFQQTRLKASRGLFLDLDGDQVGEELGEQWDILTESDVVLLSISQFGWHIIWQKKLLAEVYAFADANDVTGLKQLLKQNFVTWSDPKPPTLPGSQK